MEFSHRSPGGEAADVPTGLSIRRRAIATGRSEGPGSYRGKATQLSESPGPIPHPLLHGCKTMPHARGWVYWVVSHLCKRVTPYTIVEVL